jgi:hypothetical protein
MSGRQENIETIWFIRFLRTSVVAQRPTTGDAVPGPLAFYALRQQHGNGGGTAVRRMALPMTYAGKPLANTDPGRRAFHRSAASGFMPLAQSEKCWGAGGRAPMAQGSTQEPDEPRNIEKIRTCTYRHGPPDCGILALVAWPCLRDWRVWRLKGDSVVCCYAAVSGIAPSSGCPVAADTRGES